MKIIIYTMAMNKGGCEKIIAGLSNHLVKNNEVIIVTNIKHKLEYILDKKIKYINIDEKDKLNENIFKKILTKLSSFRTKKLLEIVNIEKPDLIISFLKEPSIRILKIKNKIKVPVYIAVRNNPKYEFRFLLKIIRNFYYKRADKIILQDDSFKKYFNNNLNKKMIIIPNYIKSNNLKINNQEKLIVCVSRLEKQKNIKLLIKSFNKIKNKDYKLKIIGNGKEYNSLIRLINKLKLNERVKIDRYNKDIINTIVHSKMLVLSSNYEGMPNVILEAFSIGLPVITTNSSDIIDRLIINNYNGIKVKKKNIKELSNKIDNLIEDNNLYLKISNNELETVKKYDENILKLWDKLIEVKNEK